MVHAVSQGDAAATRSASDGAHPATDGRRRLDLPDSKDVETKGLLARCVDDFELSGDVEVRSTVGFLHMLDREPRLAVKSSLRVFRSRAVPWQGHPSAHSSCCHDVRHAVGVPLTG